MSADFWAGYLSGAAGIVIGNPLDLVKVRLQASSFEVSSASAARSISGLTEGVPKTSKFTARTLLKGLPAPVLTYGALNALLFTSYNRSLLLFPPELDSTDDPLAKPPVYPYIGHFTAGCIAGLATFVVSAPTELIKCRAQLASEPATNTSSRSLSSWSIARSVWQQHGIRGLYHGGVITSMRDSIGYGFYFLSYEASKDLWNYTFARQEQVHAVSGIGANEAAKVLLCGGLAGVLTWTSIYPLDVLKTRIQAQTFPGTLSPFAGSVAPTSTRPAGPTPSDPLLSAFSCSTERNGRGASNLAVARHAYQTEGMQVFFRGLTVCCVRAFIVNAVQWAVYEWMMNYLSQ